MEPVTCLSSYLMLLPCSTLSNSKINSVEYFVYGEQTHPHLTPVYKMMSRHLSLPHANTYFAYDVSPPHFSRKAFDECTLFA